MADALSNWIQGQLQADATILAAMTGGIWTQPIVQDPAGIDVDGVHYRATPSAFDPDSGRILPCISISRMPRTAHPYGGSEAFADYVAVFLYGPDTEPACVILETTLNLIRPILTRKIAPNGDGTTGIIGPINDMLPPRATPEFPQAISAVERYRISSARAL